MYKKTIDNIVWWIPFKKLRNSLRDVLNLLVDIKENYKLTQENNYHINTKLDNINCRIDMFEKSIEEKIFNNSSNIKYELNKIILQNTIIEARQKLSLLNNKIIKETRQPRLIVSLTTYPERHHDVDVVIYSLLTSSILPDKIVLWLSNEEYPNGLDSVPENILRLQQLGLEIDFCKNTKSYNKLIPTLIKYPDDIIVTADDDIYYPYQWLEELYNSYLSNPSFVHCHMSRKISFNDKNEIDNYNIWKHQTDKKYTKVSYLNFALGIGGIIYAKNNLYNDILDEYKFIKLTPVGDDIWFWAMAVLNGTKINVVDSNLNIGSIIDLGIGRNWKRLSDTNLHENYNDKQIEEVLNYYPELKDKIEHAN